MSNTPFIWRGKNLQSQGDIIDAMSACATKGEAMAFKAAYIENEPQVAESNLAHILERMLDDRLDRLFRKDVLDETFETLNTSVSALQEAVDTANRLAVENQHLREHIAQLERRLYLLTPRLF